MAAGKLMRPLAAVLAIGCGLATQARADPIGERADFGHQVEAGSPGAEGGGATNVRPSPASLTVGLAKETSRRGNPLWAIPLSALTATCERPLFSVSRRPPVVARPPAPPPKQEAAAPSPPEPPPLTLIGTIVSHGGSLAMLQGSGDAVSRVHLGQENDGWRVRGIGLRSIVVEKGERSVELALPRPNGTQGR